MNRVIFILYFILTPTRLLSQLREYTIGEVQVKHLGRQAWVLRDSIGSIPLSHRAGCYLRTATPVSSAGLSIRGAGPAHTEVSWNGIPLSNPLLGQADVSLISPLMLQQATVREGGPSENGFCSSFGGSLLLGGAISEVENQLTAGLSAGSFGQFDQWTRFSGNRKRFGGEIKVWNSYGDWNYPVKMGNLETRMQHQARHFYGVEGQGSLDFSNTQRLEAGIWSQKSERQLPAMFLEENAASSQQDANHRVFLRHTWRRRG